MERKLASIQTILALDPIPGADAIERATVLGWNLVVKKGEFKVGDPAVYFEIDSLLPMRPEFEFLAKGSSPKKQVLEDGTVKTGYRLKTVRLRKQISQGLALPLNLFPELKTNSAREEHALLGADVSVLLDVVKYDPPIPAQLAGLVKGAFPGFLPKTDEIRIQTIPDILTRHAGVRFYATEKLDGCSMTVYFRNGEFGVCSRNLELKETEGNSLWQMVRTLSLEEKLRAYGKNIALQGELVGPGIQGNKYDLRAHYFAVFNVYDIDNGVYAPYDNGMFVAVTSAVGVGRVPLVVDNLTLDRLGSVSAIVEFAIGKSMLTPAVDREGLVFRPHEETLDPELGRLSFKAINPEFLLKNDE